MHAATTYESFLRDSRSGTADAYCAAGAARFVVHPTGKITRCFGQTVGISNINDLDISFIREFAHNSKCSDVRCFDPCDLDCAEKWTRDADGERYYPIAVPWSGALSGSERPRSSIGYNEIDLDFIQINLTPTLLCNFHCDYCIAGSNEVNQKVAARTELKPTVVVDFLKAILLEIAPKQGILLYVSGGEPTLWKGLNMLGTFAAEAKKNMFENQYERLQS